MPSYKSVPCKSATKHDCSPGTAQRTGSVPCSPPCYITKHKSLAKAVQSLLLLSLLLLTWYSATRRKRSVFSTLPIILTRRLDTRFTTCTRLEETTQKENPGEALLEPAVGLNNAPRKHELLRLGADQCAASGWPQSCAAVFALKNKCAEVRTVGVETERHPAP